MHPHHFLEDIDCILAGFGESDVARVIYQDVESIETGCDFFYLTVIRDKQLSIIESAQIIGVVTGSHPRTGNGHLGTGFRESGSGGQADAARTARHQNSGAVKIERSSSRRHIA
jgi:hypothetical protein